MAEQPITDAGMMPQLVPGLIVGVGPNQPFIGELVFNPVQVDGQDFWYDVWDNFFMQDDGGGTGRGLHSHSKVLTPPKFSTVRGLTEEHSTKIPLDVRIIAAAEAADRNAGLRNGTLSRADLRRQSWMSKMVSNERIQREKEVAAIVTDPNNYANGLKVTNFSYRTCTLKDLKDQIQVVVARSGFKPDTWVMDYDGRAALDQNQNLLDLISGGATTVNPAYFKDEQLAALVGVQRLVVGNAFIQPETLPGIIADTGTPIWACQHGTGFGAFVVTGDAAAATETTMAFGKVFWNNIPKFNMRYGAWSYVDDEPETIEWQKIMEMRLTAQTSKAGFLAENVTQ